MNEAEAQEKYVEFQIIQQQIGQMQKYSEELEEKLADLHKTQQSIDEMSSIRAGSEMLVPLAQGIFAKATLQEYDGLLVNVGASTVVEKSIPHVIQLIEKQKTEMEKVKQKLDSNLSLLTQRMQELINDIQGTM